MNQPHTPLQRLFPASSRLVIALGLTFGLTLGWTGCDDDKTEPTPTDSMIPDSGDRDGGTPPPADTGMSDSLLPDMTQADLGDGGPRPAGETCNNPIVLTWEGDTIVRNDDTRDYQHDYMFGECAGVTLSWEYPNEDLVYRLDFPPGSYHARLMPEKSYAYLSIIDVRTSSCDSFASSCVNLGDSQYAQTTVNYLFDITQGETVYFVIDSFGQTGCGMQADCNGPFTLTIEEFAPRQLGEACDSSWQCGNGMACLDIDEYDTEPGFCTDFCETVDCATAQVPMTCADLGPVYFVANTMACVPNSVMGDAAEHAECEWGFQCESGLCAFPAAAWTAECRTGCDGSCAAADQTCVDVSYDVGIEEGADPVQICAPTADIDSKPRGQGCVYSYECQNDDVCSLATQICVAP